MNKIILDLCGGTGSWSRPYKEAGYEVYVITLPFFNILNSKCYEFPDYTSTNSKKRKIVTFIGWDTATEFYADEIYGILAAPPCTQFSIARQTAKIPRDLDKGMEIVKKCMEIIWYCHPKFWAMENPTGILRQFMGKPAITFQPYMFGDRYQKRTDLWGYFNEPLKSMTSLSNDQLLLMKDNNREMPKLPEDYVLPKGEKAYAARRAMTPPGFANAFFKANP